MSQDTERPSDEDVATWAAIQFDRDVRRLAREVQASRKLVADLTERLRRADTALTTLAAEVEAKSGPDARLRGKLEGVRLALSYLAEMTKEAST